MIVILTINSILTGCTSEVNKSVPLKEADQNSVNVQNDLNRNNQGSSLEEKSKENNTQSVIDYLGKTVPEISDFGEQIKKNSNGKVSLIMRIDKEPNNDSDDQYREYYLIYVGENHPDHTVRWNSFYVHKDLNEVLVYDVLTDSAISLEKWRALVKQRGY